MVYKLRKALALMGLIIIASENEQIFDDARNLRGFRQIGFGG